MRILFACVFLALLNAVPAMATWRMAESAHFQVYSTMSADMLRRRVELLEDYRDMLGRFTTAKVADDAPKLKIYIVDDLDSAVPFGSIGGDAAGYYLATDTGIAAFGTKGDFGRKVLLHEYAHHHMYAATGQSYPAWYVEGFAEYFMTAEFSPARVDFGGYDENRASVLSLPWMDWNRLIARTPGRLRGDDIYLFYSQSWLLTHYLFRAPGMNDKLRLYLHAVATGGDPLAAFKTHVLDDPRRLDSVLQAYIRKMTFSRLTRKPPVPAAVTITDLPAAADDLIMFYAWLDNRGGQAKDPKAALARVQAAAARHPDDALARRTLAMAERHWGDKAKALTLLDGLLATSAEDAELLRLKAETLLAMDSAANRAEARRLLVRAAKLDPRDWRTLHLHYHTDDILHGPVNDNLFNVVEFTWTLAPQVSGIVIDYATVLVRKNRMAEAARILEPAAFDPHDHGAFTRFAGALRDAALTGDAAAYVKAYEAGPPKEEPVAEKPK
ncbi:MAG: hypothetical protein WCO11_10060 [Sphingomonadales bacterium]|jgi:tetratricopeptide (TPR) repeat protein